MFTRIYMAFWQWRLPIKAWKIAKEPHVMFGGDRWRWTVTLKNDTSYRGTRYQYSAQSCAENLVGQVKRICKTARSSKKPTEYGKGQVPNG